jgi:exodeoxyribonuclease VIII
MWQQLTDEAYFNEFRSYLSSTDIRRLLRSPAHYKNPKIEDSPALQFGSLVHEFVLLPHIAEARYRPKANVDGRTKEGKAVRDWEASLSAQQGVKFITESDYNAAVSIAASVRAHMGASSLLASGVAETAGIVSDFLGVNCRIKPDYRTESYIVDLKTCQDARPAAFLHSVINWGYCTQAAYYLDVAEEIDGEFLDKKRDFYWVAVEKEPPYAVAVYKASKEMLEYGRAQYRKAIDLYKECAALDLWPAYSQQVQELTLPKWVEI